MDDVVQIVSSLAIQGTAQICAPYVKDQGYVMHALIQKSWFLVVLLQRLVFPMRAE